ncbi:carboxypeptidase regulatory-like domain-containing protein, partial [bacterium]|nr:carboxypeptidase regulatory-like domain-containing protein [bacterium]
FTPYFLTANHCLGSHSSWVFMFNYESPGCPNQNGPTNQTVANATLRANNAASDFALLQLSSPVPLTYNPYYSGWSREDVAATNSVGIHHPRGDIKKISFDDNPPVSDRYLGNSGVANSHWKIVQWDDGTTEGGSSGSPLYDQNHRITGQLHGGYASCTSLTPDWYGKFSMSWDYGSSPSTRLRDWLDAANTGVMVLDGIDPNVSGRIGGLVTDQNSQPLADVRVAPIGGTAETFTTVNGQYLLGLQEGIYDIEFTKFGYQRVVVEDVEVEQGDTTWVNTVLASASFGVLAGTVTTQAGSGIEGVRVVVRGTPLDTLITDTLGRFIADLPATSYGIHVQLRINVSPPVMIEMDTTLTVQAGDTTDATIELFIVYIEPTPEDGYGYRAYDRYDRDLPAPFDWVELDPLFGYPGTEFTYPHHDSAAFFFAPFPITFYGQDYDSLTVNANGWMLPGHHRDAGSINRPIPYNGMDPPGIIAPYWADLRLGLGEQQFMWFDSAGGRWIFEFINQRRVSPSSHFLNWEVHLLDPAYHPTLSGDCEFIFMYGQVGYLLSTTVGIEDPTEQMGIQVLYNGTLNPTSWPIEYGSAIRFTTGHPTSTGTVQGSLTLHPPAENAAGTVKIAGVNIVTEQNGDFQSSNVPACRASALLFLAGYEHTRVSHIRVLANSTTEIEIEAWRLDPPRDLSASQSNGMVTLHWRVPGSVESESNPDVRYTVYRDGEPVSERLSDTTFTDEPQQHNETVIYTVTAHYRFGDSELSEELDVLIDLAAEENLPALPTQFALRPNYPNPFNPSTVVAFDVPRATHITLRVFDIMGREVTVLASREISAGFHSVTWKADGLPTGVYLAVMETAGHRFVQKMMLLK